MGIKSCTETSVRWYFHVLPSQRIGNMTTLFHSPLCFLAFKVRVAGDRSLHVQVAVVPAATQDDELKIHGTVLNLGSDSSWIKLKGKKKKKMQERNWHEIGILPFHEHQTPVYYSNFPEKETFFPFSFV